MNVKHFGNLPVEALFYIFSGLTQARLYECQKVCRKWYRTAHLLYLKNIAFSQTTDVEKFLQSIDHNPDPYYLKAIQRFNFEAESSHPLDEKTAKRLLSAFPNLEEIHIDGEHVPFGELDKELLDAVPMFCPKFTRLTAQNNYNPEPYNQLIYKLRHVLTKIELNEFLLCQFVKQAGGVYKFLSSFPRLQELNVSDVEEFSSFIKCLLLFRALPKLKSLKCDIFLERQEDESDYPRLLHAEGTKESERKMIRERYSKLESLSIRLDQALSICIVKFILEFFTGLKEFELLTTLDDLWDDARSQKTLELFLGQMTRLEKFRIIMQVPENAQLYKLLKPIALYTFDDMLDQLNIEKKVLQLILYDTTVAEDDIDDYDDESTEEQYSVAQMESIQTVDNRLTRFLKLRLCYTEDPTSLKNTILDHGVFLQFAKIFHFTVFHQETTPQKPYFSLLIPLLKAWKTMAKLSLEIPPSVTDDNFEPTRQFPQVTHLQLKALDLQDTSKTLSYCIHKFPAVKHLIISGLWTSMTPEYQVLLETYALERLDLDLTPVKEATERNSLGFNFLLKVELLRSQKSYVYKGTFNGLMMTETNEQDVCDVKINVTFLDLKSLNLCVYKSVAEKEFKVSPFDDTTKDTIQAKLLFNC